MVQAIHADQVRQHGGLLGIRDEGLLESALERSRQRWHYDAEADLAALAAAYGAGLAKNPPFIEGNKRVAFQAMFVFLGLNGLRIRTPEPEVVALMLGVASGAIGETELAVWIRSHSEPR